MENKRTKKYLYDAEYNKKFVKVKHVMFNITNPEDVELMEFLDSHESKNAYLKALIRADMEKQKNV